MGRRPRVEGDRGETLLELIVAIAILGIAVVAIASGLALSIKVSDIHRKQALASEYLHNYAEQLSNSYAPCSGATPPSYSLAANTGFQAPVVSVKFWNGTAFATACPDTGLQQLSIQLTSTDNRASESLVVVVRKP